MAMTTFLSRWVGEFGAQALHAGVTGSQVVAEVVQQRGDIAAVASNEGESGVGRDPAGFIQPVERGGQAVAVPVDSLQDLGQGLCHRSERRADGPCPTSRNRVV